MTLTTSTDWAHFLLICGGMGLAGQCIRAIGGTKKVYDQATILNAKFADVFEWPTFLTSMATGFAAGIIAGLTLHPATISPQFLLGVLAAGYAGADFIEAFLKKSLPDIQTAARVSAENAISSRTPTMTAVQ